MSGPIVRTGTTPEFWKNWDRVFGNKKSAAGDEGTGGSSAKSGRKSAQSGSGSKPAAKKKSGKAASKKSS